LEILLVKKGDASRIANDPAFQRTRENGSEFGRAGKGGKVIRNAIRILLQNGGCIQGSNATNVAFLS